MTIPRQPAGVPIGGQFATLTRPEPDVRLQRLQAGQGFPAHARVRVENSHKTEFGNITENSGVWGGVTVKLDNGGVMSGSTRSVTNWDDHLDELMPEVPAHQAGAEGLYDQETTDKFMRANLVDLRNSREAAINGDYYFAGRAMASATVAGALLDADADPETIRLQGLDLATGDHAYLAPGIIKNTYQAAPLSHRRARQLTGHFLQGAINHRAEFNQRNGSDKAEDTDAAAEALGASNVYTAAAVRLIRGVDTSPEHQVDYEKKIIDAIDVGFDNPDFIMADVWGTPEDNQW
ncbi:hypothetical protein [Arthrobacter sp. HLT1-21]